MACALGQRGPCYFCGADGECCTVCGEFLCASHEMLTPGNVVMRAVAAAGKSAGLRLFAGAPTPKHKPNVK